MRAGIAVGALLSSAAAVAQTPPCIPPAQWTPMEQQFVQQARQGYTSQGLPFDDQQACEAVGTMRERMAALMGGIGALKMLANPATAQALQRAMPTAPVGMPGGVAAAPAPQAPTLTEAALAAQIAALPHSAQGVVFQRFRDGFAVNGQRYVDPAGTIVAYGFNARSARYTDVVATSPNTFTIKTGCAVPGATPITIATAVSSGAFWNVTTATGQQMAGEHVIPISDGFVVVRGMVGFRYVPGQGITNIAPPASYRIARFQNGDIGATGYILLERDPASEPAPNSLGGLFSDVKSIGATLGMTKASADYALMRIDDGHLVPIDISMDGKEVLVMRDCQRRNAVVNICHQANSYDSLYEPDGSKNLGHYFWRINWFESDGHPIMITEENGVATLAMTDLASGRRMVLFHRALGISDYSVQQEANGQVDVDAQWMFAHHALRDVAAMFDQAPAPSASAPVLASASTATRPAAAASAPTAASASAPSAAPARASGPNPVPASAPSQQAHPAAAPASAASHS